MLNKLSPSLVKLLLLISSFIELGLTSLLALSTYLSYPSGLMGDTAPTTKEEVYQSLIAAGVFGAFMITSLLNIRKSKLVAKLLLIKILLYVYLAFRIWHSFLPSSAFPALLPIPIILSLYCLANTILIVQNYNSSSSRPLRK